jgi:hypothetical protein
MESLNHIFIRTGGAIAHPLASSRRDMGVAIRNQLKRNERIQSMIQSFHAEKYIGVYIQNNPDSLKLYDGVLSDTERKSKLDGIKASDSALFIEELEHIISKTPDATFYISTDSLQTLKQLRDHFDTHDPPYIGIDGSVSSDKKKKRIVYLENRGDCYSTTKECGEFAFVDMMLLGNAKRILSSDNSFADVAAIKAGKMVSVVGMDFPAEEKIQGIGNRLLGIDL